MHGPQAPELEVGAQLQGKGLVEGRKVEEEGHEDAGQAGEGQPEDRRVEEPLGRQALPQPPGSCSCSLGDGAGRRKSPAP